MSRIRLVFLAVVASAFVVPASASAAVDLIYATTNTSPPRLVSFYAGAPETFASDAFIAGVPAADAIVGLDSRPTDGKLYLLTRDGAGTGKIWTVDPGSAAATQVSTMAADPTDASSPYSSLTGSAVGIDFNPVSGRLRVITSTDQNLRVTVDTGATITDTNLTPGGKFYVGVAYSNNDNDPATPTTSEFAYDFNADQFGMVTPPNDGTFVLIGGSGISSTFSGAIAMDYSRSGVTYATHQIAAEQRLYTVTLVSGAHTLLGVVGTGTPTMTGMTAAMPNLFSVEASASSVAEGSGAAEVSVVRANPSGTASVAYATTDGTAAAGSDYTATAGSLTFTGLQAVKTISIPIADDADDESTEAFSLALSVNAADPALAVSPSTATVSVADDDPAATPPVVIQLPPESQPDTAPCDDAKAALAKAKEKLRKLKDKDAPKKAIEKAKAKVKKRRDQVRAACG